VYYFPEGSRAVKWSYDGKDYASFEDYAKATGDDPHSVFSDPKFIDPVRNNFHLQQNSPALSNGANLGPSVVGKKDLDGAARVKMGKVDIGSYE